MRSWKRERRSWRAPVCVITLIWSKEEPLTPCPGPRPAGPPARAASARPGARAGGGAGPG